MTVNHPPNHSTAPILLPVLGFRLVMSDRPSPVDDFRHQPRLHAPAFSTAEFGTPPRKPFLERLSLSQSLTFISAVFQPLAVFKSLISFMLSGMAAASQSLQQSRLPVSKSSAWPTTPPRNSASSTSWSCDDHQHSDSVRQLHTLTSVSRGSRVWRITHGERPARW